MRLTGLTLTRYGNFADQQITFDPRPGMLNLLLAPNGGGKSVLRSAFCDLLFGIGGQSPMGFRYGYAGMRITADAIGADQVPFVFGRRKGQGNTLIDTDGKALDAATIARYLGRVDRSRLERLFALDTHRLRQGEADLLASDGELGPALVSGAGGAQDLRALRRHLDDARDALAPVRKSAQRPFYLALDKFVDARRRVGSGLLKPEQWQALEQARAAAEQARIEQNQIADTASVEIAGLQRVLRALPWLAAHDLAAAWLDAHPDAPTLDPGLAVRLAEARGQTVIAEQRAVQRREDADRLAEQLGTITVDDRLLAEAAEVDRMVEAAGAARKARADLPALVSQAAAHAATVAGCLRELGSTLPVDRAAEAIPPRAVVARSRQLIQDHGPLLTAAQAAPGLTGERLRERDAVLRQIAALLAPGDVSELDALVKDIRADGDPDRRGRAAAERQDAAAEALAAVLARVPGWTLRDAALAALAPLSLDAYDRHAGALTAARAEATARSLTLQTARQARDEAQERLASVTTAIRLPDAAGLQRARDRREAGWQLVYRRGFTADPPSPEQEQAYAGALPLPLAYEQAVTAADDVADQRVARAAEIERAQAAHAADQEATSRWQEAALQHDTAIAAQHAAEQVWTRLCAVLPLGGSPTLREVQGFLVARDKVIDARQDLGLATAAAAALETVHAAWAARLSVILTAAGTPSSAIPPGIPPAGQLTDNLAALLAVAEQRLLAAQQAGRSRAALDARREAAEAALLVAQTRQRQADAELAAWRHAWSGALRDLDRPADEDPRVTDGVLQVFTDLDQARRDRASVTERVSDMHRDTDRFAAEAVSLAARVAPELERADPFPLVAAMRLRLQQAREMAKQRDLLREQSLDAAKARALADRQLADRQGAQQAILVLSGAPTVEAAEQRLALAAERARHAANLAQAEAELRKAADHRSLTALRAEAAAVPVEEIEVRAERAAGRRQDAQAAAQEAAASASALTQQMKQTAEATTATDAAADQQAAVATLGRVLEEALVHQVAGDMLDRALAAVERDGEPALLRRIGTLFSQLTEGAYSRVLTEIGDDNATRLSLLQRDYPHEQQSVRDLSEGTRDQLYLALRLAAIEAHAASAPPLPFIGDDILQTFDDDRALAAMRVLGVISEKVQVILLTHHPHVLALAARLPAGSVHTCRIGVGAVVE